MPRKKRPQDLNPESEALNAQVNLSGAGEDPAIKALLSDEFATMPNTEAVNVALMLQQIVRGQNAILENQTIMGDELSKLKSRMDSMDKDSLRWEEDRQKFLTEAAENAERLRIKDPDELERFQAKQANYIQNEIQSAVANSTVDKLRFDSLLASQPKEMITSPGRMVMKNVRGVQQATMEPETIRIRHRVWVLPPNMPVEVPKLVADEYRQRIKDRNESAQRKSILNADAPLDNVQMAQKWNEISKKSNPSSEQMPFDSR